MAGDITSFHLTNDAIGHRLASILLDGRVVEGLPRPPIVRPGGSHVENKRIVTRERGLTYQFRTHYHPWVTELTRRLVSGSTAGLEAVDTEHVLRISTTEAGTATTGAGGSQLAIAAGEALQLPDGSVLELGGSQVRTAGRHLVDTDDGVVQGSAGSQVRLTSGTRVVRSDRSRVELTADLTATLTDGAPRPTLLREFFDSYQPDATLVPATEMTPHPVDDLDFSVGGAYSVYNWELFFHVPFTIAVNLTRSGRYPEAMQWLHLLFDPTTTTGHFPEAYWKVKPFQTLEVERIEDIMVNLSTGADPVLQHDTINAIQAWQDAPFRPHVVARFRQSAYMFKTVMAYLDNLVAWGDSLFRQDTGEAIDEALQLYVLAAAILGPRPQALPNRGTVRAETYATLRGTFDEFGNTMRDIESSLLFDMVPRPSSATDQPALRSVRSIGHSLYFAVPGNDRLLGYWRTVGDRLFKIRNSQNIEGVFRQLPLFEPPIDPAMLARAAAAGLDTAAIVAATSERIPLTRFAVLHRQATELAQQASSLGSALLSAIEKSDGEALTLLRSKHERTMASLAEDVRYGQLQEAVKAREALLGTLNTAVTRYAYYERLLGVAAEDVKVPELDVLDLEALAGYNLRQVEPGLSQREPTVDIATDLVDEAVGRLLNRFEAEELSLLTTARTIQDVIKIAQLAGQGASLIPDFGVKFHFWGLGGDFGFGGTQLAKFARFAADVASSIADDMNFQAGIAAKVGGYARREQEWAQQSSLAASEINQVLKQLRGAQLREAVAEHEWRNQQQQSQQLAEVEEFLNAEGGNPRGKVANQAVYSWLRRDLRTLHSRTFALATDVAASAQRALQHELGKPDLTFLGTDYLAGHQGLLAGEKLLLDLKRMELAYQENNQRELEVVQHVSLAQLNPIELMKLRALGTCQFDIPEAWLDLEGPGHYFRRLRSVSVSIPCVTGPYTSINCRLSLRSHSIRLTDGDGDLEEKSGGMEAVVVSTGSRDPGIADTSGQDGRRLPFELAGAISSWQLDLPGQAADEFRTFDYDTISDVVLHLRFTARQGSRAGAKTRVAALASGEDDQAAGRIRMFSVRHEFPAAWAAYAASDGDTAPLTITLTRSHFPFWSSARIAEIEKVELYAPPVSGRNLEQIAASGPAIPTLGEKWEPVVDTGLEDVWLLATCKV